MSNKVKYIIFVKGFTTMENDKVMQRLDRIEEKLDSVIEALETIGELFTEFEIEGEEGEEEEESEEEAQATDKTPKSGSGCGFRGGCGTGCCR